MFCPNCGKSLPDAAAFCSGCGCCLEADTITEIPVAVSPEYTVLPEESPLENIDVSQKATKKKRRVFPVVLLAVLVLAAAVFAVVRFFIAGTERTDYFYLSQDGELMYMADFKEKTEAIEVLGEDIDISTLNISPDGKYAYFLVEDPDVFGQGDLYRVAFSDLKKDEVTVEKLDTDVDTYYRVLGNGNLCYARNKYQNALYLFDGETSHKLENDFYITVGIDPDQKYYYYQKEVGNNMQLCRVPLVADGEPEVLIEDYDSLCNDHWNGVLLYSVDETKEIPISKQDTKSIYVGTLYSVVPGEKAVKLADNVVSVGKVRVEDKELSFSYLTYETEEQNLYSFVSDPNKEADEASTLEEPEEPDWNNDYQAYRGIFEDDDGREYYEVKSGKKVYLDKENYSGTSASIAYAMADDLYEEACNAYEEQLTQWETLQTRKEVRKSLKEENMTTLSYNLFTYKDGESTLLAEQLATSYIIESENESIFFYERLNPVEEPVAELTALTSTTQVCELVNREQQGEEDAAAYYVNINGTEREFDAGWGDISSIKEVYGPYGDDLLFELWQEGELYLCAYELKDGDISYAETLAKEDFSISFLEEDCRYYVLNIDEENHEGDLYCWKNGKSVLVHKDISNLYQVEDGTEYVCGSYEYDELTESYYSYIADLFLCGNDGKQTCIGRDVWCWYVSFLPKGRVLYIADGDLYLWDGKDSKHLVSEVEEFWPVEALTAMWRWCNV